MSSSPWFSRAWLSSSTMERSSCHSYREFPNHRSRLRSKLTDLTSTAPMNQENYFQVCSHQAHPTSKGRYIWNPETFVPNCDRNFHNLPTANTNNVPQKRDIVCNRGFWSPKPKSGEPTNSLHLTVWPPLIPNTEIWLSLCAHPRRSAGTQDGPTKQIRKTK